jgi:hypothetical protein
VEKKNYKYYQESTFTLGVRGNYNHNIAEKTSTGGPLKLEDQIVVEIEFFTPTGLLQVRGSNGFEPVQQGSQNSENL